MFDKFLAAAITSSNVTTLGGLVAEGKKHQLMSRRKSCHPMKPPDTEFKLFQHFQGIFRVLQVIIYIKIGIFPCLTLETSEI